MPSCTYLGCILLTKNRKDDDEARERTEVVKGSPATWNMYYGIKSEEVNLNHELCPVMFSLWCNMQPRPQNFPKKR